ncbi:phosphotransferase [Paenibacillus gallinarum]|uniref:phosphotransferase n=1 Tax=Paenibacillus gallinarum TaxID=2762232 RepID=UPI00296B0799|nr:phosphotransferase [Paenibacillus gallinarum]
MNDSYHIQFEKLCCTCNLGEITKAPVKVSGGLLHRMFAIETTKGKYAVKALNPQIMERPTALPNYIRAEKVAVIASTRLPALPAMIIEGEFIQKIDHQYYLIFEWIEGNPLKPDEIDVSHCKKIGAILSDIHNTDFSQIENHMVLDQMKEIDWGFYLEEGKKAGSVWVSLLRDTVNQLYIWTEKTKQSPMKLSSDMVISHRDLEPKNVMWSQGNPIIIDWESAGAIHPKHDVVETALYWSVNETGGINREKLNAFVNSYFQKQSGEVETDWGMVLSLGFQGKLEWLEYSLKRSLNIESTDANDQEQGTAEVTGTIMALKAYEDLIPTLETWLNR